LSNIADAAKTRFLTLHANATSAFKEKFLQFTRDVDLCKYYADLAHDDRSKELWTVVKLVMVLPHGSATVKGAFPSTKSCSSIACLK